MKECQKQEGAAKVAVLERQKGEISKQGIGVVVQQGTHMANLVWPGMIPLSTTECGPNTK